MVVLGLTALSDSISVYIGSSPKQREKEKRKDRGEKKYPKKNKKKRPPAQTASAIGPCPTIIQIVGRPGLEAYPGPSHHPTIPNILVDYALHLTAKKEGEEIS